MIHFKIRIVTNSDAGPTESRGRALPPSRAILNCACFAGSYGDGETSRFSLPRQQGSTFCSTCFPPGDHLFRAPAEAAASSTCRRASLSLQSLGLAVVTAFLLSTISLGGSCSTSSTPSAFPHWDTRTVVQCKQQHGSAVQAAAR